MIENDRQCFEPQALAQSLSKLKGLLPGWMENMVLKDLNRFMFFFSLRMTIFATDISFVDTKY